MSITIPSLDDYEALSQRLAAIEALTEYWDSITDVDASGISRLKPTIWHANSGPSSEKRDTLIISGVTAPYQYVVYSIKLPTIMNGDLIEAWATFEVTHEFAENVMVCRGLRVCDSPTATAGTLVSADACRNVTPGMHHDHIQDFGSIIGAAVMSGEYLNFIAYANHYDLAGKTVRVEQNYGRLIVKVTRMAAMEAS